MVAVFTAADLGKFNQPSPLVVPHPSLTHGRTQRPLAVVETRYVGEGVAFVVAESRETAEDAAALVDVDWEPLPAAADFTRATEPGQPLVHADVPDNVAARLTQVVGDPDVAFARATHVFGDKTVEVQCDATLESGMLYQFRATSIKQGGSPIAITEDLRGVFLYK